MPQVLTYETVDIESQSHFHNEVKTVAATHTITGGALFPCDTTAGGFTITLPSAEAYAGRVITIKKMVAANTLTVAAGGGDTIDGSASLPFTTQYDYLTVQSDGLNWLVIT